MELESVSFNLSVSGTASDLIKVSTTTTGTFINLNLKQLLGILFYKYEKFMLNCCGVYSRTVGMSSTYNGMTDITLSGLPFINNTDTSIGMISSTCSVALTYTAYNTTPQYSNANGVTFLRPSNEFANIILQIVNSDGYTTFNGADYPNIVFKITGIPKPTEIIYRPLATRECVKFVLNTSLGVNVDGKNAVVKFEPFDMRTVLGKMYDRYSRFQLVTNQITMMWNNNNNGSYAYASDSNGCGIYMSGLDFTNTFKYPTAYQYVATAGTSSSPASLYYKKTPVMVGMYNNSYNIASVVSGNLQALSFNQNVVNIFERTPYPIIYLINAYRGTDDIQFSTTATTIPYPSYICDFTIYGIDA